MKTVGSVATVPETFAPSIGHRTRRHDGAPEHVAARWVTDYIAGRERVLGGRCAVADAPSAAADQLAARHGGHGAARRWAREVIAAAEGRP